MKNKILFISATHGDEGFSIPILNELEKRYSKDKFAYDRIIGNPKAFKSNTRQIEGNLNRLAPGNLNSIIYEEKRAYKIMQIAKKYSCVIDLHGADSDCGIVIIMCNPTLPNFILAGMLDIQKIIIWDTKEDIKKGPLTKFCQRGLEIECGPKNNLKIQKGLEKILTKFIKNYQSISIKEVIDDLEKKEVFQVYDKLIGTEKILRDFIKTSRNNEFFYPFMSNQYLDVACYKLKKVKFSELFLSQSKI